VGSVVEASIAELRDALNTGAVTSVELVAACLTRIATYDHAGILLNAVPVLNPDAFADARASDERRRRGETRGPLDGIPYTAKDSFSVAGLTVAAGSPAFADLIATEDAHTIALLREAGAVLIGLTNMPPMANGGMQRGLYGRAESPYNADYLTSAFGSGSSNGSGTATAASFAVFGLGEETWSSGRAPASCNALVAYTPSRGVISVRGNWPLVPTMDVVVPHTRSVADLLEVLDVLVADDPRTDGDFWRTQPWVQIPRASAMKNTSFEALAVAGALNGKRLGVPRMYIGTDSEATTPIETRATVIELWKRASAALTALGATVVEVDFPVVSNYERDRPGTASMVDRGIVPAGFAEHEIWDLSIWGWDTFLRGNADQAIPTLAHVKPDFIFPAPTGALPDQYGDDDIDLAEYVERAKAGPIDLLAIPDIADGIRGLEETRRVDLEQWMDELGLDAVVFPAVADIGPADADVNVESARLAWRNGTWVANGNLVPRHLGIPTVTVPMGTLDDIGMPVGLTFAGRGWDDRALLGFASDFASGDYRTAPPRTPELASDRFEDAPRPLPESIDVELRAGWSAPGEVWVEVMTPGDDVSVTVDGIAVALTREGNRLTGTIALASRTRHSEWLPEYEPLVVAVVRGDDGSVGGAFTVVAEPGR